MSKPKDTLKALKTLLGMEVKLEQMKLENGTVIEADSFEVEQPVFIITEDEKVPLPVGEYELEDGKILVIAEEGIISEIKEEIEEEVEEEMKEEMGYATKEELAEVKKMVEDIKAMLEPKEEMAANEPEELEEQPTELSEVPQEVQEQLDEPAVEAIKHNPDAQTVEREIVKFGQNRPKNILDNIYAKLNN